MSFYGSRALAHFGTFGIGAGLELFPGGPGFQGGDTWNLFFASSGSAWLNSNDVRALGYSALSQAMVNSAAKSWTALQASEAPADVAFRERVQGQLQKYISSADSLAAQHDIFGNYASPTTTALVNVFKQIQTVVKQIAGYVAQPAPPASADPVASAGASARSAMTAGSGSSNAGGVHPEGPNYLLYAGLGVGALVLLGGVYFVAKPKKVSGYRKRRRR